MMFDETDMDRSMRRQATLAVDWDLVYAEQLPRIYNYFRFRFGGSADAEDLTARTFEKAWRGRHRYKADLAGFSTWLYKIAQNAGVDHLRARRAHLSLDAAADLPADATPEQDLERDSDLVRLAQLTAALPEHDQELIALKYGAGISNRQIAHITGLSESNVGTRLHRLVQELRSRW